MHARGKGSPTEVSRAQVLAHRVVTQGLDRRQGDDAAALAVVDLGVQDTPAGSAAHVLAARLPVGAGGAPTPVPDDWIAVWAIRGAPHLHRPGDLQALAAALWPADAADATARLAGGGRQLKDAGVDPIEALRATAEALRALVTEPMPKGEVSAGVTRRIPDTYSVWCRGCQATHVTDQLMRLAALPAGLQLVPGTSPPTLAPIPGWKGVPGRQEGAVAVAAAYLRLHGPATAGDVAGYLQTTQKSVRQHWPDGLVEVRVEGRRAWLPEDLLDGLQHAPPADLVRLIPRSDPWLLARDRDLLVPDAAHRKALWPVLGAPGGVLVDGEVAGLWRTKATARRLELTVRPFRTLPARVRRAIDGEAALVASARGTDDVRVVYDDG